MSCLHTPPYTTTLFNASSGKKYSAIMCTRKQLHVCTEQTLLTAQNGSPVRTHLWRQIHPEM